MSSSVFKIYPSSSDSNREEEPTLEADGESVLDIPEGIESSVDDRLKIDSNLVIVVGKDGSVHVDQKTLHSLLANETTDTSVSVVRITSPTPSIEEEIEEERRLLQEQKLEEELESVSGEDSDNSPESSNAAPSSAAGSGSGKSDSPSGATTAPSAASSAGVTTRRSKTAAKKDDVLLDDDETPHVSLMVEGFYPPAEAKKFASEILTLAGLQKPLSVDTTIDYEFQRYVIANDHCYTPLTSPSQKLPPRPYYEQVDSPPTEVKSRESGRDESTVPIFDEGHSGSVRKRAPVKTVTTAPPTGTTRRRKSTFQKEERSDAAELQSILEDSDSDYSEESSFPEEDDSDSDFDFSITGKQPKKRKSGSKNKSASKLTSKRDEFQDVKEARSKKVPKASKKPEVKLVTPVATTSKHIIPKTYGSKRDISKQIETPTPAVTIQHVASPAVTSTTTTPVAIVAPAPVIKKDKKPIKPAPHVEALFSDMTSLFSAPDIIKKVGTNRSNQPLPLVSASSSMPTSGPSSSSSVPRGFVQLSPVIVKGAQKLPTQISIQTHTSASEDKQLDLIDSLVQQEMAQADIKQSQHPQLNEDIVTILENNLPPGGVSESGLPITDNSILAALGSNDDGLPEDLLQHVAELAENKELQEILDKQVLGVIGTDPIGSSSVPMALPSTSATVVSISSHTQQVQLINQSMNPSHIRRPNPESLPTMTVKEQLMPRKEAIQIRRSDGRVITLPPIEAPATRSAKRRAQTGPSSSSPPSVTTTATITAAPTTAPHASPLSSAGHHMLKIPKHMIKTTNAVPVLYDDGTGSLLIDENRGKGNRSGASSRRTSESSSTSAGTRGKRASTNAVAAAVAAVASNDDDIESDESWNSEDDPDRLWCICKQPHNNRFMICCDVCEDWFHGKCVNITKAMGQQMEEDGIEWTCPNCLKTKHEKQQPKMTEFLVSGSGATGSEGTPVVTQTISHKVVTVTVCVVCTKPARASSVYCSDECIRKHAGLAHGSTQPPAVVSTKTTVVSTASSSNISVKEKPKEQVVAASSRPSQPPVVIRTNVKVGPIIVMERTTGRCLTGKNAPTAENLQPWLLSNPTFELVPPGSPQAVIILTKQQLAMEAQKKAAAAAHGSGAKVQAQLKLGDHKKLTIVSPGMQQKQQPKVIVKSVPPKTSSSTTPISKGSPVSTHTPKVPVISTRVASGSPTLTGSSAKQPKKTTPEPKPAAKPTTGPPPGENIRVTVKKTLKEHLIQRTNEQCGKNSPRLNVHEIDKFAEAIEGEMFALFNKDTGAKYRAKYRSLVFNIKDRKNLSLFQKICEKRIEAKQLVRMTAEELASQELAQWRENENKHQLEMIKKSELDLLACAKNYVLKTHKGEEVIEGKSDQRVRLDPMTSVEDVVAVLNNSTVSSTSELDNTLSPSKDVSVRGKDYDFGSYGKYSSGSHGSGLATVTGSSGAATSGSGVSASSASASLSSSKKKETRRSRSRSSSRDRRRDRSRSRSKHKRRRSRSHDRHGSREHDRDRDRDRGRERGRSRHRDHKSDYKSDHRSDHKKHEHKEVRDKDKEREKLPGDSSKDVEMATMEKDRNEAVGKAIEVKKQSKKLDNRSSLQLESFNLVDQILASADGSDGRKLDDASGKNEKVESRARRTSPVIAASTEQDQEPTSTVTIPTPPHSTSFDSESPTADFISNIPSDVSEETRKKALLVHWTGNVHMIDLATVEMSMRSVSGDIEDVAKDFSEDLTICGTIKPEIVWEYIGQIRKSPNKEVCLVRLHSNESSAYYTLYSHLLTRKRYSVIKSPSSSIKDFYIFPLPAEQMIPMILKPLRGVGIIEGNKKPDLLLGIIVKIQSQRIGSSSASKGATSTKTSRRIAKAIAGSSSSTAVSPSFALMQQVITKYATVNKKAVVESTSNTPPRSKSPTVPEQGPPAASKKATLDVSVSSVSSRKRKSASESPEQIDMDIIKAPVSAKAAATKDSSIASVVIEDDDDEEPYSPGGGSDDSDNFADVTAIVDTKSKSVVDPESERIRMEMEEINRKIAEEKNEIVGLISKAELKEDEIKSTLPPSLITDISIPSNLSEILASIKAVPPTSEVSTKTAASEQSKKVKSSSPAAANDDDEDEYIPSAPSFYSSYKSNYAGYSGTTTSAPVSHAKSSSDSKLSKLTDEELLRMVPDVTYLQPPVTQGKLAVDTNEGSSGPPATKKSKWESSEPPPPGMEDELETA